MSLADEIRNIVIVRFSLRLNPRWIKKAYGSEGNREAWFKYRSELFKQTLGNSIRVQTKPPEKVYILMDEADSDFYARYLIDVNLEPIFSKELDFISPVEESLIKNDLIENVAISRIDSDDIIARNYFEQINCQISDSVNEGKAFDYVVACRGYRSDCHEIQKIYYNASPFVTLFRKGYSRKQVWFNHTHIDKVSHIQNHTAQWMQTIHGNNVGNRFRASIGESLFELEAKKDPTLIASDKKLVDKSWFESWCGFVLPDLPQIKWMSKSA